MSDDHAGSGLPASEAAEPSLAERARTLVSVCGLGTLSTHSRKFEGFPFGSMMPYAADGLGRPIFFVSSMAMHTHNLQADWRASLLVVQPQPDEDPLGAARLTLLGAVEQVAAEEVRGVYLDRHPNARQWQHYSDFSFYRLYPEGVYFVGGFSVMGWISADEYIAAAPDPLAPFAAEIIAHTNTDESDMLLEIARQHAGPGVEEARMTSIDRLGFCIRLRTGNRGDCQRIPFLKEVRDAVQARTAVTEMIRLARNEQSGGEGGIRTPGRL